MLRLAREDVVAQLGRELVAIDSRQKRARVADLSPPVPAYLPPVAKATAIGSSVATLTDSGAGVEAGIA